MEIIVGMKWYKANPLIEKTHILIQTQTLSELYTHIPTFDMCDRKAIEKKPRITYIHFISSNVKEWKYGIKQIEVEF